MTSQRGHVFQLKDGSWAYRYRNHPGRKPEKPQRGGYKTKKEATRALEDQLRRLRLGPLAKLEAPLGDLIDVFLAQYDRDPTTVAWMKYHLQVVRDEYGDVAIGEIDPADVGRWLATAKTKQGKQRTSRHQTAKAFKQVLHQAVAWGWLERSPLAGLRVPDPKRVELRPFDSWADIDMIGLELGEFGAIPVFAAGTGLRPEETFGLEWRDVDLDARIVVVQRVWTKGRLKDYAKTAGSRRRVPLRQRVVTALEAQAEQTKRTSRSVVFPAEKGGRIDIDNWRARDWKPAVISAGLDYRPPYALRHTYATWSLAAGVGLFSLARRMGTSLQMIEKTYGHLAIDADEAERATLDAFDRGDQA